MTHLKLGALILTLSQQEPTRVMRPGLGSPHSYRGWYERVAFEPVDECTVSDALRNAVLADGKTFQGYKGGSYRMGSDSLCHVAKYGHCDDNDELTADLLTRMLGNPSRPELAEAADLLDRDEDVEQATELLEATEMSTDLDRLAKLADATWGPEERSLMLAAVAEIRALRKCKDKPTALGLLFPDGPLAGERTEPVPSLRFVIPTPPSSKNARRARRLPTGLIIQYRPKEIVQATEAIQATAIAALKAQAPRCYSERAPLLPDEDVEVVMVHNVRNDTLDVTVTKRGPCPSKSKGATGRKRDVVNLPELVLDAIQRIAYRNDNQVCDLRVWRNVGTPSTATE